MTYIYRVETPAGTAGDHLIRGYYSEREDADRAARHAFGLVKGTVTPLNLDDPIERDDICSRLNRTIHR